MSTTPRTDAAWAASFSPEKANFSVVDLARTLETELAAMTARAEKAEAKIITARSALSRIANSDYRGNRSTESQIAFAALEEIK
jgi:hypothetical protein